MSVLIIYICHIYPYFSLTFLIPMASPIEQSSLCSFCARPWHSTQFKTCDNCRRKARTAFRARKRTATVSSADTSTNPPPSRKKRKSKNFPLPTPLPILLLTLLPRPQFDYCRHSLEPLPSRDNRQRSLAPLVPAPLRARNLPIIANSGDQQRTGHDQTRPSPTSDKHECLLEQALNFLRQDLHSRIEASNAFPPHLSPTHIRSRGPV
jgi:hypothetical protein